VLTGSELVRGDRHDLNGPYLAHSLLSFGLDPAELRVVGDVPVDIERAFRDGLGFDLMISSGGLGPTHDDRSVELLASVAGRALVLDDALEADIGARSSAFAERMKRPYADFSEGVRKQATIPEGAIVVGLVGTAPGLVLELGTCVAVMLPGPPRELQPLWGSALETEPVRRLLARARRAERRVMRFYGVGESQVAQALAGAGGDGDGVEMTICARDSEVHVDLFVEPGAESRADELEAAFLAPIEEFLFSRAEAPVEELVLARCRERGWTLATAESCTGGLVSARLTSIPGSSDVFAGGIVSYSNAVKETELGVPPETLADFGAVSAESASAMARGARQRLGVDLAVSITGIAGPAGGSAEKPVGLVYLCASGPAGESTLDFVVSGDRETVRRRAAIAALHLLFDAAGNRHRDVTLL
jgi:nicotinamide-nucleotide amidase